MRALGRYAPLAALVAAQLVVVLLAPSKPVVRAAGGGAVGYTPGAGPTTGATGGTAGSGAITGAGPSATSQGNRAVGGGGGTGTIGPAAEAGLPPGDTSHCRHGQQWDVGLTETPAPPCVPKWGGGNNGGATSMGVTRTSIEVVYYREKDNPVVAQIEKADNLYSDPNDQRAFLAKAFKFVNTYDQFYGRLIHWDFFQGQCSPAPPDPSCYRNDAKRLVGALHPFAVIYDNNTNAPAFFDQLSRLGVVNWGGWAFSDQFDDAHRPFHWDVFMGGDKQAEITGEWYCKKLANKKAKFSGERDLKLLTRKAAIIFPDVDVNRQSAQHLDDIINRCQPGGAGLYPYSPDTTTAAEQATTNVNKEKAAGITTLLWFSDPIAPIYGTKQQTSQQWFPENVIVGSGLLDYAPLAQLYDQHQWAHAFGPSDLVDAQPFSQTDAAKVWRMEGGSGDPYTSANLPWAYVNGIAGGLQMAGPSLTPYTYEHAMLTLPAWGGWQLSHHNPYAYYIKFGPGDYTAFSDQREVYWDPNLTSPSNGRKGEYVGLHSGERYRPGDWTTGDPQIPPSV